MTRARKAQTWNQAPRSRWHTQGLPPFCHLSGTQGQISVGPDRGSGAAHPESVRYVLTTTEGTASDARSRQINCTRILCKQLQSKWSFLIAPHMLGLVGVSGSRFRVQHVNILILKVS